MSERVHALRSTPPVAGPAPARPPARATGELLRVAARRAQVVQLQLRDGGPGDALEREADRVGTAVAGGGRAPVIGGAAAPTGGAAAPASVAATLGRPGQPLDGGVRARMEARLGHDFSDVRVHTDPGAGASARDIQANAYTAGSHLVFAPGRFDPSTGPGARLLAHELTHVVQQRRGVGGEGPSDEQEEVVAAEVVVQREWAVGSAAPAAEVELTAEQVQAAITYNRRLLTSPTEIARLRDVLGVDSEPATVDEDFVRALGRFQAHRNVPQDGRLSPLTASRLSGEVRAEARALGADGADLRLESRLLDRRSMTITVVAAARELTQTGSAEYRVRWGVPDPQANGWVIQHVRFTAAATDCAGRAVATRVPNGLEYWEAWQVRNGRVFVGGGAGLHVADTFRTADQGPGTRGTATITGHVTYMPGFVLREPPWGHTVPQARALPTRTTPPAGWSDGLARLHRMVVRWDACAARRTHSVTATP